MTDSQLRARTFGWFLGLAIAASAAPGRADDSTPPTAGAPPSTLEAELTGPAKDEYDSARALIDVGDPAGALVKFQRAYELSHHPRLLWDMGACELKLQHYVRVLRLLGTYQEQWGSHFTDEDRARVADLTATLRRLVSEVHVRVNEDGANVFLDEELVGKTPLAEPLLVNLGKHRIRIAKPGFQAQVVERTFAGASDTELVVAIERDQPTARVIVTSAPDSSIQIDHGVVDRARWDGTLPAGSHVIVITASGMKTYHGSLDLRPGETRSLDITLEAEKHGIPGYVWVAGAVVAAAGLGVGGYFLFRPGPATQPTYVGTIGAGQVQLP
jgi:hypothetical protein